jgi:hypothetical protein
VRRPRAALAGAVAALVWGALEPIDMRLFRNDYSDVAMLGKLVTQKRAWPLAGLAIHATNGALFGLVVDEVSRLSGKSARRVAPALALAESFALFPLAYVVDRKHPARGQAGVGPFFTLRGLVQETTRHAVFGVVLGRLL